MARLVLATFGSLGDLHPMLALALELQRRGHDVVVATSEMYRGKISALGLAFAALRPDMPFADEALVRRIMDGVRGPAALLRDLLFPAVRDLHADLDRIAAQADAIVASELVYAAPLVGEHRRIPWVTIALAPLSVFSPADASVPPLRYTGEWVRRVPPWMFRAGAWMPRITLRAWWRPVRRLRRELGLPPGGDPLFEGKFSPWLNLALFSRAFAKPQPDWPPIAQTGFCFFDEPAAKAPLPERVASFLRAGDAPIVFTLGSAAVYLAGNFYDESVRATTSLGRRALLLLGSNPAPADLPPSVLAWDYLPFAQIFPRAAAIVHQGGIGTTAQALRAGRPMIVMPFAYDQFDNAARITRLGAGRRIMRRDYRAPHVARELRRVLETASFAQQSAVLREAIAMENGRAAAAGALENLLEKTRAQPA